jgi:hypothetical protein
VINEHNFPLWSATLAPKQEQSQTFTQKSSWKRFSTATTRLPRLQFPRISKPIAKTPSTRQQTFLPNLSVCVTFRAVMSELPTADLLSLDTDGLRSRLSKLRRYL